MNEFFIPSRVSQTGSAPAGTIPLPTPFGGAGLDVIKKLK